MLVATGDWGLCRLRFQIRQHAANRFADLRGDPKHPQYFPCAVRLGNEKEKRKPHGADKLAVKIKRTASFRCSSLFLYKNDVKKRPKGGASPSPTDGRLGNPCQKVYQTDISGGRGGACSSSLQVIVSINLPLFPHTHAAAFLSYYFADFLISL